MKRKLLPLFLLTGLSTAALAQPTLTGAGSNPLPGDSYTTNHNSSLTDPGPAGPGQTWNFGAATSTMATFVTYTDCSGVSDCGLFPGTTVVGAQDDGNYAYLKANSTVQGYTAMKTPGTTITYSDIDEIMRFPFSYNDTYTDTWMATFNTAGMDWQRKGTTQVTADAHGTLITPAGTFSNVLRLHYIQNYKDSTSMLGMPYTIDYVTHMYVWFNASARHPLYAITQLTTDGINSVNGSWVSSSLAVNEIADLNAGLEIFPQPASGRLHLRFNTESQTQLSLQMTDITGRTVLELPTHNFSAGNNETVLDISALNAGIYFLQLKNGHQHVAAQKVQVL